MMSVTAVSTQRLLKHCEESILSFGCLLDLLDFNKLLLSTDLLRFLLVTRDHFVFLTFKFKLSVSRGEGDFLLFPKGDLVNRGFLVCFRCGGSLSGYIKFLEFSLGD